MGQVFQRSTLEGMQGELRRQYVIQGRYDSSIDTEVIPEPRNRVSISIEIDEGTVSKIKHINIVGNKVFDDETLLELEQRLIVEDLVTNDIDVLDFRNGSLVDLDTDRNPISGFGNHFSID